MKVFKTYDELIYYILNDKSTQVIKNEGKEHTRIALKAIFESAKSEINWVIDDESLLHDLLTRDLYETIKAFVIKPETNFNLLVLHEDRKGIFRTCLNNIMNHINFYTINSSNHTCKLDFITWDNEGYRVNKEITSNIYESIFCANDKDLAKKLNEKIKFIYEEQNLGFFKKIFNFFFKK